MAMVLKLVMYAPWITLALADSSISGGGIFMKIQGQSGKMTFATTEPIGSAEDRVQIEMDMLQELSSDGTVLGGGGNAKHSFNSFATQEFTFGNPVDGTIAGVARSNGTGTPAAKDYQVTKVAFTSYLGGGDANADSKLQIESIIFKEDATLKFENPDGTFQYPNVAAGTVKFNVVMSQWNWCENNGVCKSSDGVGDSVKLTIKMTNEVTADSTKASSCSGTTDGCGNGAVEDLGGLFLGVLNVYSIENEGGTKTQYTLAKNPTLTVDPPIGSTASRRTTTMVLEFPRTNFGATDTLIYDPLLSYSDIAESSGSTTTMTTTEEDSDGTTAEGGSGGTTTAGSGGLDTTTGAGTTVLEVTLTLTVSDPTLITGNEEVKSAMVTGFATVMGVQASQVSLTFQVSRRLHERKLQTTLIAIFSVTFASAADATAAQTTIDAVSVTDVNTAITTAVQNVPSFTGTIEVTGVQTAIQQTEEPPSHGGRCFHLSMLTIFGSLLAFA